MSVAGNVEARRVLYTRQGEGARELDAYNHSLDLLVDPVCPKSALDGIDRFDKTALDERRARRCGLQVQNLLTLVVLVQNHRKDGQKGLVLSAQCQLVSVCGVVDDIMKGRVEGDRAFVWQSSGSVRCRDRSCRGSLTRSRNSGEKQRSYARRTTSGMTKDLGSV